MFVTSSWEVCDGRQKIAPLTSCMLEPICDQVDGRLPPLSMACSGDLCKCVAACQREAIQQARHPHVQDAGPPWCALTDQVLCPASAVLLLVGMSGCRESRAHRSPPLPPVTCPSSRVAKLRKSAPLSTVCWPDLRKCAAACVEVHCKHQAIQQARHPHVEDAGPPWCADDQLLALAVLLALLSSLASAGH